MIVSTVSDEYAMSTLLKRNVLTLEGVVFMGGVDGRPRRENLHFLSVNTLRGGHLCCIDMAPQTDIPAVAFKNAFKSYGSMAVLHNFQMTVQCGTIYALLGASGCGKTTALSCAIGRQRLTSGEIHVFGRKPNDGCGVPGMLLGYMPQEKGLFAHLTIHEMVSYFARIYGMSTDDMEMRMATLIKFLQLPHRHRFIHTLSGGQQKRVSFAIALLHQPKLLILDEPTVGVDSLLRQIIWDHLRELTKDFNTTIIVTTHYIEEARQAHIVGMMRSGRILAEEQPGILLRRYQAAKLEDVFLALCIKDQELKRSINGSEVAPVEVNQAQISSPELQPVVEKSHQQSTTTQHIRAILWKNVIRMRHDYMTTLVIMNIGPFVMFLYSLIVGSNPRSLNLGVVNHEWPHEPLCAPYGDCLFLNLSCRYLESLRGETITLVPFGNEESALQAVKDGHAWGYLSFHRNFSDGLGNRLLEGMNVDDISLENTLIEVRMDMSNYVIGMKLYEQMTERFYDFLKSLSHICEYKDGVAQAPIEFGKPVVGRSDAEYKEYLASGVFMNALFSVTMFAAAALILIERQDGMLSRVAAAGVTDIEILLAQLITQLFMTTYTMATMMFIMGCFIHVPLDTSFAWMVAIASVQGATGVASGLLVSTIITGFATLSQANFCIVYPCLLLSGVLWPLECVNYEWFRQLCYLAPTTWGCEAFKRLFLRKSMPDNQHVWPGFLSLSVWFVLFFGGAIFILRMRKKK